MFGLEVNKRLLPMKGHYFLWNAGTAPIVPFMTVYAKQLGFSSYVVGIIYTILPITGLLGKPIFGAIADRFQCQKKLFILVQIIAALTVLGYNILPEVQTGFPTHLSCSDGEIALDICSTNSVKIDSIITKQIGEAIGKRGTAKCRLDCSFSEEEWNTICKLSNSTQCYKHPLEAIVKPPDFLKDCMYFEKTHLELDDRTKIHPECNNRVSSACDMTCDIVKINEILRDTTTSDTHIFNSHQFWMVLLLYMVVWMGQSVVVSISDTICFELLDDPNKYGVQRQFGALGWGLFSFISGGLVDYISGDSDIKSFTFVFSMGIIIMLLSALVSTQIQYEQRKVSASILRDIGKLVSNFKMIVFIFWCTFVGMCTALMWNFLFWLLEDLPDKDVRWIKTIEGLVMAMQTLCGELPFFYLSGWILKSIGHVFSMALVLLVFGIRFIYYSLITNPWMALPIEISSGLTFGLFYATMTSYASTVAPSGTEATTQGLVGAAFEGIGVSTGSFIAGLFFQTYGSSETFRIFGIFSLIAFLVFAAVQAVIWKCTDSQDYSVRYATPQEAINMADDDLQELKLIGH